MRWFVVMMLVGCNAEAPANEAPHAAERPVSVAQVQPATPGVQHGRMHATWSEVRTTDSCWYFSGPDGRDTRLAGDLELERDGETMRMKWGDAIFTGTFKAGELDLARTTTHDFDGAWRVTEHIRGKHVEGAVHARYSYEECEHGTPCPNHCTITATLDLAR